jgi:pyruvate formate lyase activating enzyme
MTTGIVFNTQRYSVHDGPGIRTIAFLKGCPLHCQWCSNPEGQASKPQMAYNPSKCIGSLCRMCLKKSQEVGDGIISWNDEADRPVVDFTKCKPGVLTYAKLCPAKSMTAYGEEKTPQEVIKEVERDLAFYVHSQGGVTFSGGEPMAQPDFLIECLDLAHAKGISTCIETTCYAPWDVVKEVVARLDTVYMDIKHMDSAKHKKFTGVGNDLILDNMKRIGETFPDKHIRVRTPVIPLFNDTDEELLAIRAFVDTYLPHAEYEILKYHKFGENKYDFVGKPYPIPDSLEITDEDFARWKSLVRSV